MTLLDKDSGEITDAAITSRVPADKETFIKVFLPGIEALLSLSKGAQELFVFILRALADTNTTKAAPDQIYFNFDAIVSDYNYPKSRPVFTSSVNELCAKEFIAKVNCKTYQYYINPGFYFKGNRTPLILNARKSID